MRSLSLGEDPSGKLYPDLLAAGGLAQALKQHLPLDDAKTLDVRADRSRWSAAISGASADRGTFRVYIGADRRGFGVSAWRQGVMLVHGATNLLVDVAGAAVAWFGGASLAQISARYPFIEVDALSLAHERGPAEAVDEQWRQIRADWSSDDRFWFVADIIEAAYAAPALRQLFPYTSHASLCFSTCTGFPYSDDIPQIDPSESGYVLRNPWRGEEFGAADDAEQAVAMLVALLPPGLGPAVAGAADSR